MTIIELLLYWFGFSARENDEDQQMIKNWYWETSLRIRTFNRISQWANKMLKIACAASEKKKSGTYDLQQSSLIFTIQVNSIIFFTMYWSASDFEFKFQFQMSLHAFKA